MANNKPVFSLNHLDGRTFFVGVGDKLGPYTVVLHKPITERIFNKSINAYQSVKADKLFLRDESGKTIMLVINEALEQDSMMAGFVSMETGKRIYARASDSFVMDRNNISVIEIDESGSTILVNGDEQRIPVVTESDEEFLYALREQQRQEREESVRLAMSAKERLEEMEVEEAERAADRAERLRVAMAKIAAAQSQATVNAQSRPSFTYGYEYPSSYAYTGMPVYYSFTGGQSFYCPTVPTRFSRYYYQPAYGYAGFTDRDHHHGSGITASLSTGSPGRKGHFIGGSGSSLSISFGR